MIQSSVEYQLIRDYYGEKRAQRSGVPLINHIEEGLIILAHIGASEAAQRAYCLHPLFQTDEALKENAHRAQGVEPHVLMLTMEYRNIANAYLSKRHINDISEIALSPLPEVNQMLVADKIQNFKDFMIYHHGSHPRTEELHRYFGHWFERLEIPRAVFDALERGDALETALAALLKEPAIKASSVAPPRV